MKTNFGDLGGLLPISKKWGYERGTPIDRRYIGSFLTMHRADVQGHVLEIGNDFYTRRFGRERVTQSTVLDIDQNSNATIIADLTNAPELADDFLDCVILTQVLGLIEQFENALATVVRCLKPAGVALITVPGISQISSNPKEASRWSWSFYPQTFRRILSRHFDPHDLSVESYGNVKTTIGFLCGLAQEDLSEDDFGSNDPRYPLIVAARAVKLRQPRSST